MRALLHSPQFATLLIACSLAFLVLRAWTTAAYFDGQPIDGPFQLFDALDRMHAGQAPWRDFLLFHGLGVLYVHYPFFELFGHDLFASEFVRQLLSPLVWIATMTWLTYALTGRRDMVLYACALFFALSCASSIEVPFPRPIISQPGNSLMALRWAYPAACGAFLIWAMRSSRLSMAHIVVAGVAFGFAPYWSFEQGAYAAAAAVLTIALSGLRGVVERAALKLAVFVVLVAAVQWTAFTVSTGDAIGLLRFVFRTIPQNQGWYFGAPPNHSLAVNGLANTVITYLFVLFVLGVAVVVAYRRPADAPDRETWRFSTTLLFLGFCMAGASLAGYLNPSYLAPGVCALIAMAVSATYLWLSRPGTAILSWESAAMSGAALAVLATFATQLPSYKKAHDAAATAAVVTSGVRALGIQGSLGPMVERVRAAPDHSIFSTYRGLLELAAGADFVGRSDYIIHALGDSERSHYLQVFDAGNFAFVHTVSPTYTQYEEWLQDAHWDFYRRVIEQYAVVERSGFSLLWQKRSQPIAVPPQNCRDLHVRADGSWPIDAPTGAFMELTVDYRIDNALGALPILGSLPRFLLEHHDLNNKLPLSLDPARTRTTWLVGTAHATNAWVKPQTHSPLPGASLVVNRIVACDIAIPEDTYPAFTHLLGK